MTIGSHRQRIWWLSGLALILALFGHDALMAAVASPASMTHQVIEVHAGVSIDHPAAGDADSQRLPEHPSDCGSTGAAVPCLGNEQDTASLAMPAALTARDAIAVGVSPNHEWSEPFWPPGTRRALLQVYRI